MAGISSLGIGSGLDLSGLVDNLLAAERGPVENTIARQQNRLTTELSGVGIFRGAISSFRSSLAGLQNYEGYTTRTFSNAKSSAMDVSISNDAAAGSYTVDITNLAEQHSLASSAFTSLDEVVGTGTIEIKFGTITGPGFTSFATDTDSTIQTITIDSTNNTLSGMRDYINNGDYGVTASIINDGTGYKLTLQSDNSGANAAMQVTITDTGDASNTDAFGLSRLAYNASATNLTQTQAAEDAALTINGLPITSTTNSLTDTIEGVSLTLKEQTDGTPFTVSISESTKSMTDAITKVVDGYNQMMTTLNELSKAGVDGSESGILVGDSSLRSFVGSVRSLMTSKVSGLSGAITALSTIGVKTQSDGTLSIDSSALNKAVSEDPEGAVALFAQVGQISDSNIKFNSFTDDSVAGLYAIDITQIATQSIMTGATGLSLPITIDSNNDNLSFYIDGISTGSISLTQGSYTTGTDLATELQLQINSVEALKTAGSTVTVAYDTVNDGFIITSNKYGSDSKVEITSVDTNTVSSLGLSVSTATAGQDVAGTIGGNTATGSGQTLTSSAGKSLGLSIDVTGGSTGSRGNLPFTRGLIESIDDLLANYLDSSGILTSKENSLNSSLEDLQTQRDDLDTRIEAMQTRLINQFSALDALVANFQSTGNFLAQQIDSLPGFSRQSSNN